MKSETRDRVPSNQESWTSPKTHEALQGTTEKKVTKEHDRNTEIQSFLHDLPNRDGYVDFSQLKQVGNGGTHDVFIDTQNPTFVVKLNRGALDKAMEIGQAEFSPDTRKQADTYVEGENKKNEQLYKIFGKQHCLREKVVVQKIHIDQNGASHDIEGVVTIQESSDIFQDPSRKDFSTGYAEGDPSTKDNKDLYDKMNTALLGNGEFNENDFLAFNEKMKPIFALIESDERFADCAREFLLKFKEYFETTGNFIDLVGEQNVLFHQENGKWTYKLGSVVKGENKDVMKKTMGALEEHPEQFNQDAKIRSQLLNQLALIRLLNAAGLKAGIGKIIPFQLTENQRKNLDTIKFI